MSGKSYKEAWDEQEDYDSSPHGWIQWKGTDVCIDIYCECGEVSHFDGDFMYMIECPHCGRKYFANGHIQLIEIEKSDGRSVRRAK